LKIPILVLLTFLMCGAVRAQEAGTCEDPRADVRIVACSALIAKGRDATADLSIPLNNRGLGYASKEEYDQAIRDYTEAIAINPNFALAFSNRGVAYEAKGLFGPAIDDYSKAIAVDPKFRPAYNNRCYALSEIDRPNQAIADCDKALMLQGDDARTLDSRGYMYFRLGRYTEAIGDLNKAHELDPSLATVLYVRGMAKARLDDRTAPLDFEEAKRLDRDIERKMAKVGLGPAPLPELPTSAP